MHMHMHMHMQVGVPDGDSRCESRPSTDDVIVVGFIEASQSAYSCSVGTFFLATQMTSGKRSRVENMEENRRAH